MTGVNSTTNLFTSATTGFDFNVLLPQRVGTVNHGQTSSANATRVYSVTQSRDALNKAIAGAKSVLDSLSAISAKVDASSTLASTSTARTGLQGDIRTLTRQIDTTVANANASGVNLISGSSSANTYRIATTNLGGSVTVASQPLDSTSLGINRVDVTTQAGTDAARSTLATAIQSAVNSYLTLSDAGNTLAAAGNLTDGATTLSSLASSGLLVGAGATTYGNAPLSLSFGNSLARGSLVDITA